jgi:hypothetical protein
MPGQITVFRPRLSTYKICRFLKGLRQKASPAAPEIPVNKAATGLSRIERFQYETGMNDEQRHPIRTMVDDTTLAWLMEIADLHHASPDVIVAAILRDVARDDLAAHDGSVNVSGGAEEPTPTLN